MPRADQQELVERAAWEPAEAPRGLRAQLPFRGGARFGAIPRPLIRAGREAHAFEIEALSQPLALGHDIELHSIAALEAPVDRSREHFVTFPLPREVSHHRRLELAKDLPQPAVVRARLIHDAEIVLVDPRPRDEAQRRLERIADPQRGPGQIPEVVGVIDLDGRRCPVARDPGAIHYLTGKPDAKVALAAAKVRGRVGEVRSPDPPAV